jgi:protein-tyrosine-phosphatase/tRNA A37 threonylcarbamoyladenosine synthetase subunit TsaC/SUA5/YrdC
MSWQRDDPSAIIDRAVSALAAGELIALPSDTGCEVMCSALHSDAVTRLTTLDARRAGARPGMPTVALASTGQLMDWLPRISFHGIRLARRIWPGPVVLVSDDGLDAGLHATLPEATRTQLKAPGFRVPDHDIALAVLSICAAPVLAAPAPQATAHELERQVGAELTVIIEDAESPPPRAASLVRLEGDNWTVLEEGAVSKAALVEMTARRIVFVCTGNTCRSPLAAALCTKLLAERLGCAPEELPRRGYAVLSAGLAAYRGAPATPEAVDIARELGADLSRHSSRALNVDMLLQADDLVAMTRNHLDLLLEYNVPGGPKPRLLAADGSDVPDPIGGSTEVYRDCAQQIRKHLDALVTELCTREDAP